jgi:hypothetical protein
MVARAKTAEPETPEATPPEPDGSKSATIDDVKHVVHEAFEDFKKMVFDGNGNGSDPEPTPDPEPVADETPLTDRQRESRMEQLMGRAVATLLEKDAEAKAKPEKVEPETPPLQKIKRATRVVWGVTE